MSALCISRKTVFNEIIITNSKDMKLNLPKPANWDDFQDLCCQLWRELWGDMEAHQYGRLGQRQNGVDIYGKYRFDTQYTGVQCKGKNGNYDSFLTTGEIDDECKKAAHFQPNLGTFIMATTSPRDVNVQNHCNNLNAQQVYPFKVDTWAWDDIEDEVQCRQTLMEQFYPTVNEVNLLTEFKVSRFFTSSQKLYAFFSRPGLLGNLNRLAVNILQDSVYEIAINAFEHGGAATLSVKIEDGKIILTDDGKPFDTTSLLKMQGNGGSATLKYASQIFGITYKYDKSNIIEFTLPDGLDNVGNDVPVYLALDAKEVFGREQVQELVIHEFGKIPKTAERIVIDICGKVNPAISMVYTMFDLFVSMNSDSQEITVYLPGNLYYKDDLISKYAEFQNLKFIIKE